MINKSIFSSTRIRLRTIAKFKSHVKMHEIVKPFKCKNCKQCYHDENALKLHMVGHLEMLPFPCKFCGKRFRHKGLLNVSPTYISLPCRLAYEDGF